MLKGGCYTIKKTRRYELYQIGEKIYKFEYKTFKLREVR
mgnify:CR=1 FL=1